MGDIDLFLCVIILLVYGFLAVLSILTILHVDRDKEKNKDEESAKSNVSYSADELINSKVRTNQGLKAGNATMYQFPVFPHLK